MVQNAITLEELPRRFAVEIERQWYDPLALDRWLRTRDMIPHTRQPPTPAQRQEIARKAAQWATHQGVRYDPGGGARRPYIGGRGGVPFDMMTRPPPRPAQPDRPVYFRRHLAGGGFKYYRATGATTAEILQNGQWRAMANQRLNELVLVNAPARVDVSLDFAPSGAGQWDRLRLVYRTVLYDQWSARTRSDLFYRAIQGRFRADLYSHLWRGHT